MDRITLYFKEAHRIAQETEGRDEPTQDGTPAVARMARMAIIQRRAREAVEAQLGKLKRIRRRLQK